MIRVPLALIALTVTVAAGAQPAAQSGNPPQRVRSVMLNPGEKCPAASSADEVVVCANMEDRYRIPKELRNEGPVPPQRQAWAAKQEVLDEVGREAGGLPNTCSPVGTGGQSGCTQIMLRRAQADQRNGSTNPPR